MPTSLSTSLAARSTRAFPWALALAAAASTAPSVAAAQPAAHPQSAKRASHSAAFTLAAASTPSTHVAAGSPAPTTDHRIVRGDTLGALARRSGATVAQLRALNGLTSNRIVAGHHLLLPSINQSGTNPSSASPSSANSSSGSTSATTGSRATGSTAAGAKPGAAAPSSSTSTPDVVPGATYTIRDGDTLTSIAARHQVTLAHLRAVNPTLAQSSRIRAGETLRLPQAPKPVVVKPAATVANSFAGRTYSPQVVAAAQTNKQTLTNRQVPTRAQMQQLVVSTAQRNGVDAKLAQAIAYQESGFNMRAVSPANAVGVMQVIPSSVAWASGMAGHTLDPLDPQDNVTAGVLLLKAHLQSTGGDVNTTIAAYYQGLKSVKQNGNYADTTQYVKSVSTLMQRF